ncbi:sugar kinase [Catellatospora methionotrophica]|uniref:Sugar kinase n=1 Tax=Catellatospora methionotrophica TaxID=121620 RepID=A0A8J3PD34_9ACTN|nr:ROK family protein [Catellatospora methionotrophica]GIG11988.1 sugar kinase [Catellatospora methionotrophica]
MTGYVAALDIGGTTIKSALHHGVTTTAHHRRPTPRQLGPEAVVAAVLDEARALVEHGTARHGTPPAALGVACLGMVDEHTGTAVASSAIGWHDVPLRELLAAATGLPVTVTNDLRAAAHAEARTRDDDDFLFVAVGTGIGGAIVTGGDVRTGAHQRAGEIGHLTVHQGGYRCGCGAHGCLEAEASASAVARRHHAATGGQATARDVARLAATGDTAAAAVWQTTVSRLATGLSMAATLLDPGVVVVGGGLSLAGEQLLGPLREAFERRFRMPRPPRLVLSTHGDESACVGAALMALEARA